MGEGWINHDRIAHEPYVDVAHDLDVLVWPWRAKEFDHIKAHDVMEHLKWEIDEWLRWLWGMLKKGGTLELRLPAWDNPVSYRDPTHKKVFHEETFDYWDPSKALHKEYGCYYFKERPCWWHIIRVERVNPDPRYGIGDLLFVLQKI